MGPVGRSAHPVTTLVTPDFDWQTTPNRAKLDLGLGGRGKTWWRHMPTEGNSPTHDTIVLDGAGDVVNPRKPRLDDLVIILPGITGSVLQKDGADSWAMS